ncbi:hypothetical protein GGR50DRAFT_459826 [Xylaria sp. CBS 124048]|nr:hypothetical protein GGR50DRAFT_459826 [Xylaria sp. CBS 124048]
MKGRPVDQLVYEVMFPKPRSTDVPNFQSFLHRHLIHEVRQEVHSFYGHLDTQEAKYPGLDYCHPIHRIRLSRWTWHRRLFRAFDTLRLTHAEIAGLTKWEGTKWAKDRFEHDSGIRIRDTASDGIGPFVEPEERSEANNDTPRATTHDSQEEEAEDQVDDEGMVAEEDSDIEPESIGFALNQGLRERAEAGEMSLHYEEEWEQWLKNAIDSGEFPFLTDASQQPSDLTLISQALFPPNMLNAARAGHWDGIPDWLRDIIRRTLDAERTRNTETTAPMNAPPTSQNTIDNIIERWSNWQRPTYASNLRLPANGETASTNSAARLQPAAQPGT